MSLIRILEVFREPIANGGQESFIMNMYRNIDRNKIQFDFLTPFTCDNKKLKAEIEKMGGKVYHYDYSFGEKNNVVFKRCVTDFLRKNQYSTVHFHSGSTYALMEGSKIAHHMGVKNIIVHSHCGGFVNLKYKIIKTTSIPYLMRYPTEYFACSHLAAEWKFPSKIIKENKYKVIKNAVDVDKFFYNPTVREEYREKFGLTDKMVVGHIGRFEIQKNHRFLVEIFEKIHEKVPESVLVLIGAGDLRADIEHQVQTLGLQNCVKFLGIRKDIPELLNMMDLFVMPSFFEGLPVVGVEAQATGLPMYMSNAIAKELPVDRLSFYLDIGKDSNFWAEEILKCQKGFVRKDEKQEIIQQGYEIRTAAKKLEDYYLQMNK